MSVTPSIEPLELTAIEARLRNCPRLPSLSSISHALRELLDADQRFTSQISDVIRRDPSLTSRLLRLVNSVYYGITTPVKSIEEAVFYLGVRQIRQLAMVTPVIEDFQKLAGNVPFPWRAFWQHCIATALLTSEVVIAAQASSEEADYVAGLVHDVGKIAMAAAFPQHFAEIRRRLQDGQNELLQTEQEVLGVDHSKLGGMYLRWHNLPEVMIETAEYHHSPGGAKKFPQVVAAVQVADLLVRQAKIGTSGNPQKISADVWVETAGWGILFPDQSPTHILAARNSLRSYIERLPAIVEGLV
jgi:putative nucleotidyltransferase with HDIG domain